MSYRVRYEHDGKWWVASVDPSQIKGCSTQGRTVAQARERIREAIACAFGLGVDVYGGELVDEVHLPGGLGELSEAMAEIHAARRRARALKAQMRAVRGAFVRKLADSGLSRRDIGDLMGLSHQRVHQIAEGA